MEWHDGLPRLKMTGHASAERIASVFASVMVDTAYVIESTPEVVLIVADDPEWPADHEDFEYLCAVIREALAQYGIEGFTLSFVPGRAAPPAKDVATE